MKRLFAKEPILKHPDPERPFIIQADANDVAVAEVLLQRNAEGNLKPCTYTSKRLTETEQRWVVWEKAYVARWALLTWRHFLEGSCVLFEVWTDHKNLEVLTPPKKKLSPKEVRWAQYFK